MRAVIPLLTMLWFAGVAAPPEPSPRNLSEPTATSGLPDPDKKQDAEKKQDADKKQDPAGKQEPGKPEEKKDEEKPALHRPFILGIGYADWGLDGNLRKFRQYATPPRSFFLDELLYAPLPTRREYGLLSLRGLGEDDHYGDGKLSLLNGRTQIEGFFARSRFYDLTPTVVPVSGRDAHEIAIMQRIIRGFTLSARYRFDNQDQHFEAPRQSQHQRTRYTDVIAAGRLGKGLLHLSFSDWRYFDRTSVLQDTKVDRWTARYLWELSDDVGLEGAFSRATITQTGEASQTSTRPSAGSGGDSRAATPQTGVGNGHVETVALTGDVAAGPLTDLIFRYRRDKSSLPVVQNAYVRDQRRFEGRIVQRWKRWSLQLGLQQREVERVRGDQTFVDVPDWITFDGRLSGRLNKQWRLTVRGSTQTLNNPPPMVTLDPRPLYWKNRDFAQVKLDGGTPDANGYLTWSYRHWDNSARAVSLTNYVFALGGNWQATPALSVYVEYDQDVWTAKSDIDFPSLNNFAPNSRQYVFGLNWVVDPRTFVSLSYSETRAENDNPLFLRDGNTNARYLTVQARYQLRSGHEIGLLIAPWEYRDRVTGAMNYDAMLVMVTTGFHF